MNKQVQVQRLKSHEKWRLKCLEHGIEVISPAEDYFQGCFLELRCLEQNHVTKYQTQSILVRLKKEITLCPACHVERRPKRKYHPTQPSHERLALRRAEYETFCEALVEKGWKMVSPSEDYKNTTSVMTVLCPTLHNTTKTYQAFMTHKVWSCEYHPRDAKYTPDYVRQYISERGAIWTGPDSEYRLTSDYLSITCKCKFDTSQSFDNFRKTQGSCWECKSAERVGRFLIKSGKLNTGKRKDYTLGGLTIYIQGHENYALNDLLSGKHEPQIPADEIIAGLTNVPRILHFWGDKPGVYTPDIFLPNKGRKGRMIEVKCDYFLQLALERNFYMYETTVAQGYEFEVWVYTPNGLRYKKITISLEDDSFIYVTEEIEKPTRRHRRPIASEEQC